MKFRTNPLPGMNPWLEAYWGDIHTSLTTYARDCIQGQLPADLQARVEEYLAVEGPEDEPLSPRRISPDVQVIQQPGITTHGGGVGLADAPATEPIVIRRKSPPPTLRYIQIVDLKAQRRVVTAIEFISLANKTTAAGRKQYRAKQNQFIDAEVNLVEIDLLRRGKWVIAAAPNDYPVNLKKPYRICVVRANASDEAEIYPATFAAPLPTIKIPLRTSDTDVLLPLQMLINQAYDNGRYGNDLDYSVMPLPAFHEDDQKWITTFLASQPSLA